MLYLINPSMQKCQNGQKLFVWPHMTPRKVYGWSEFRKLPSENFDYQNLRKKLWKPIYIVLYQQCLLYSIHIYPFLTNNIWLILSFYMNLFYTIYLSIIISIPLSMHTLSINIWSSITILQITVLIFHILLQNDSDYSSSVNEQWFNPLKFYMDLSISPL